MSKQLIYNDLFATKTLYIKDFKCLNSIGSGKPHEININRALSNPILFDNITLQIENIIKTKSINFNKICATSISAIPYATNTATSFEKAIAFVNDGGNIGCHEEKANIANIKIEGGLDIDDQVLLIETVVTNDFYLENIVEKIRKYGGNVVGIILIINQCEGEYCNLTANKENILPVLNLFDIFNYLENNNLVEMFYSEKIKFYCEKETKLNIKKLIPPIAEVFPDNNTTNSNNGNSN